MKQLAIVVVVGSLVGEARVEAKPTAPVIVYLQSRPVAGGFEVTLVAVAREDLPALELDLGAKHVALGQTMRGQARALTATFAVAAGAGNDVVGSATVREGRRFRNAPAMIRLGAPTPVEKRVENLRTLPDGTKILEVR